VSLLEFDKVEKVFQQGEVAVRALRGISLRIEEQEFTAIVGPSGSGKTTLLNLVGGLDRPTAGSVRLNGNDLAALGDARLSRYRLFQVGFIFQAYNLIPVLSALENVEFVMVLQGRPKRECRERAMQVLERVGLADLAHRRPSALSGGQQQRVAVARALAGQPRLVLADEPTANLDTQTADGLLDLMHDLNHRDAITFLFSTHDPRVMARAERVITLQDGQVLEDRRTPHGHE
jgi:putative ABC transport system ATP-binding protein